MFHVGSYCTPRDRAATSPANMISLLSTCNSVGAEYVFEKQQDPQ